MSEKVDIYCNEIKDIIENGKRYDLFNNITTMQLNWYGPFYEGIGGSLQECSEIFYKKLYYEIDEIFLQNKFKLEIIVSAITTKIRYVCNFKKRIIYDKIFMNNNFNKSKKEIKLFNSRLVIIDKLYNNLPIYIWNRINNKHNILVNNKDIFLKIYNFILCNTKKNIFAPELIQNLIICLFNIYY